ncbi:hypothetical protein DV738_g1067, partial [Chaetothyriales sp. CBS 135597]
MGNSQTKEARSHGRSYRGTSPVSGPEATGASDGTTRQRRGSRPDLSFLGIGSTSDQDSTSLETRRENKQEREARRQERERQARLKERARSMREESVDGGYLVTQGVYVGPEDYNKAIVRQLMIERRVAPFWKGLNDFSESWTEHQLMAAARGLDIPPADQVPPELEYRFTAGNTADPVKDKATKNLTIPIGGRSPSLHSDHSGPISPTNNSLPASSVLSSTASPPHSAIFRTRAKTLASLTTSSRNNSGEMVAREIKLPADPFVNGQPIEAYLYKDAAECPICFLYYPPYLNTTRCCEQPICSECFVQIKRPDPHIPEHEQPDPNAPPISEEDREAQAEGLLVSEVATCPYCKTPEFGITYTPPPFRRGLTYATGSQPYQVMSAMSSQTSVSSSGMSPGPARRRGTSLSANAPEVVTTDRVRPDWASKLATARAQAARRAAAATALHTAAYLMNGQADGRPYAPFSRRGMLRRSSATDAPENGRKSSLFAITSNTSSADLAENVLDSSLPEEDDFGKGKGIDRRRSSIEGNGRTDDEASRPPLMAHSSVSDTSQESLAQSLAMASSAEPFRRSHLRQMSNASSASSSLVEPAPTGSSFPRSSTPPPGNLEPMFNFQSLAAMVDEGDKTGKASHLEHMHSGETGGDSESHGDQMVPLSVNGSADPQHEKEPGQPDGASVKEIAFNIRDLDDRHEIDDEIPLLMQYENNLRGPLRHPRPLTAAELHLEVEKEQESIVNRLTRELSALRAQTASVASTASSTSDYLFSPDSHTSTVGTAILPPSSRRHRSSSNLSARSARSIRDGLASATTTSVSGVAAPREHSVQTSSRPSVEIARPDPSRQNSTSAAGYRSTASAASQHLPQSNPHRSSTASVATNPATGNPDASGTSSYPRSPILSSTALAARYEEAAQHRSELEAVKRENELLRARVKDLEKSLAAARKAKDTAS